MIFQSRTQTTSQLCMTVSCCSGDYEIAETLPPLKAGNYGSDIPLNTMIKEVICPSPTNRDQETNVPSGYV